MANNPEYAAFDARQRHRAARAAASGDLSQECILPVPVSPIILLDEVEMTRRLTGLQALVESFGFARVAIEVCETTARLRMDIANSSVTVPAHIAKQLDYYESQIITHASAHVTH